MNRLKGKPPAEPDPLASDFSQERADATVIAPILQWHGGLAALLGNADTVAVCGGFFLEDSRLLDLGLEPNEPTTGFERVTLRLGGKQIPGWGARALHLAFILTDFCWEDRETGKLRFPPTEYERRKQQAPGTERQLRGRLRALVAVRELMDEGVLEPLVLSVRGTYSAALNTILRDAQRMVEEATKLRRQAGGEGGIALESFWVRVEVGEMEEVGDGSQTSRIARPTARIPADLTRAFLLQHMVEESHRRPGGTFDAWVSQQQGAWAGTGSGEPPTTVERGTEEADARDHFYTAAISLGYWNETEVQSAMQALGYRGIPLREPQRSQALAALRDHLNQPQEAVNG